MTDEAPHVHDVITMGRVSVDVYPQQTGPLEDVTTFSKSVGGSATNVAVAAARHGADAAVITRTGNDPFGRYIARTLPEFGVANDFVEPVEGLNTPVAFCEIFPPDDFPLYFYRAPKAPDLMITSESLPLHAIERTRVFWTTVTGLSEEPSRSAHHAAAAARSAALRAPGATGRHTVLDLDYRAVFWPEPAAATREVAVALDHATVAVGNREECEIAVGETDPLRAADALLERGVELAIVKQGPRGVLAKTRDETVAYRPHAVDVVNGLGSGDGFGGALVHGLLQGWSLDRTLAFANAAGAIVATRFECSTAMPTSDEVEGFLRTNPAPATAEEGVGA
ncbi:MULTISPECIES: 5-dehydro-2-deoxygluconokinase [unclassified Curtobacterium]|uniref:5-dehydro-2-deoxygluconokinase n=1 Tax=unclassified Curtobacterium TaxID=257496 RepID=UPI001AE2154C|nr:MULTISPECIES: 5-dehydro-2-deoxygluconokinase [unclassified Curtobacterium]MBP1301041.1 5-dehydro-2-deoxygluconokinase [Curtobacterium sp. 1310]MDP9735652.1 5-dehydro-2-deoxygluconokinase [Curtobacterium sp. 260]